MSFVHRFETGSPEETILVGRELSRLLPESGVVSLVGDLGAGKTTLVKGIAEARYAARAEDVSSPTYTLIHEYGEPVRVYHVDLYRLETIGQARGVGLEDLFDGPALVLIEWGDRFPGLLPPSVPTIRIHRTGPETRLIELS